MGEADVTQRSLCWCWCWCIDWWGKEELFARTTERASKARLQCIHFLVITQCSMSDLIASQGMACRPA